MLFNFHMTMNCTTAGLLAAEVLEGHDLSSGVLCQGYVIAVSNYVVVYEILQS
jgi:hypothetical protein